MLVLRNRVSNMECHDFHEKKNEKNKKIIIIKTPLLCKVIVKLAMKQHVNGTIWGLRFLRIEQYTEQWLLLMLEKATKLVELAGIRKIKIYI